MAVATPDEYRQQYVDQIQPHLAEPILAVGFVSTPGYASGLVKDALVGKAISSTSFLAGRMFHRGKRETRDAVVQNQLVAITSSNVFLFDFLANGRPFEITAPPTVWSRAGLRVTAEARGRMSQRLHVEVDTSTPIDVDVNFSTGPWATFNDALLDLLVTPSP